MIRRYWYDTFWLAVSIAAILYLFIRFTPSQLWRGITSAP